jgi:hypothetical protein
MVEHRAERNRLSECIEFPAGWTDLLPELNQQPEDHIVTKQTWGAFTNTDLDEYLKKQREARFWHSLARCHFSTWQVTDWFLLYSRPRSLSAALV